MELFKILKLEFNLLLNRKEFLYAFTVSLFLMIIVFFINLHNFFQEYMMNIPSLRINYGLVLTLLLAIYFICFFCLCCLLWPMPTLII